MTLPFLAIVSAAPITVNLASHGYSFSGGQTKIDLTLDVSGLSHSSGITDTLACGISIGSHDWGGKGIVFLKLIMCHVYDWKL